jgi:prepilin-type N-terminal cleavage/methylation domain-containing protein/prepilin-type processing-associated H-X9-DG protein
MPRKASGFTLIELLVVIAIIAVLATLAFPAVGSAMSSSQRASALSSIKQISTLAVTYAADHHGMLPEEGGEGVQSFSRIKSATNAWYNVLPPLAGLKAARDHDRATFHGPESVFFVKGAKYPDRTGSSAYFAYGINSQLMDNTRTRVRLHQISQPSRTALFAEAGLPDEKGLLPKGGAGSDLGQPKVRDRRFIGRHNGTGIIGFADGHAEVVPVDRAFDTNVVRWELATN